jgi:hypothetical protein
MPYRPWYRDAAKKKRRPKRRPIKTFEAANLQLKRGIWHAVLPVPRDVQSALGSTGRRKLRFSASLKTRHLREAERHLPAYISTWKAQIAQARHTASKRTTMSPWTDQTDHAG